MVGGLGLQSSGSHQSGAEGFESKFGLPSFGLSKTGMLKMSLEAFQKLFGNSDPFQFTCPMPGLSSAAGVNLPYGLDRNESCCRGYNEVGWPYQFAECKQDPLSLCESCWKESSEVDAVSHPMIRFAGVGWAASVTVTGDAKPKYGWLGGALQVGVDDLLGGNLVSGSQVENAAVNQKMMNVRLGVGIYNPAPDGITVDVCPGNQDWKVDMLNEEAENIHARVFKSERA
ncbi:unnamed protein product, partial [Polarella glacialis]